MKRPVRNATSLVLAATLGGAAVPPAFASAAAPRATTSDAAPPAAAETEVALVTPAGTPFALAEFEKAQDTSGYNSEYIFALTRGLADSTMHPAGKVPLFIFTLPLDVVFLPFAAIAGLFG